METNESAKEISYIFLSERHIDVECVVHIHTTMEIVIVNKGTLTMTADGKKYDIIIKKQRNGEIPVKLF